MEGIDGAGKDWQMLLVISVNELTEWERVEMTHISSIVNVSLPIIAPYTPRWVFLSGHHIYLEHLY